MSAPRVIEGRLPVYQGANIAQGCSEIAMMKIAFSPFSQCETNMNQPVLAGLLFRGLRTLHTLLGD